MCETTSSVSSCPTSGTNIKNSRTTPYFTETGDWLQVLRPVPGSTGGLMNSFNASGYGTSHQVTSVAQSDGTPSLGTTTLTYNALGQRTQDNNTSTLTNDQRDYTFDARGNLLNVHGKYKTGGSWHEYDVGSAFDHKNRRVFKFFLDNTTGVRSDWWFYYDALDRLVEVWYVPVAGQWSTYSIFHFSWLEDRLVGFAQSDFPSGTVTKRYVNTDESGRPIDMWSWPSSGNATRVWAINPSAWGFDTNLVGPTVYQPVLFAGQYSDPETAAFEDDGTTRHRPGLVANGFRTYDPFIAAYLTVDPRVAKTWSPYGYAQTNPVGNSDPRGLTTCSAPPNESTDWECDDMETISVSGTAPPESGTDLTGLLNFFGMPVLVVSWPWQPPPCPRGGCQSVCDFDCILLKVSAIVIRIQEDRQTNRDCEFNCLSDFTKSRAQCQDICQNGHIRDDHTECDGYSEQIQELCHGVVECGPHDFSGQTTPECIGCQNAREDAQEAGCGVFERPTNNNEGRWDLNLMRAQ
jgi:RHS repeat-associated protein